MSKQLYTFLVDFKGGTYINQVKGTTPEAAFDQWVNQLDYKGWYGFGKNSYKKLIKDWKTEKALTALSDTRNVWCFTCSIKRQLFLVNIVKTVNKSK